MQVILFALWFFLPAGLANGAPVIANKIPGLNDFKTPIDFGKHWRGKRLMGDNKTWRGLLFGIVIAAITLALQQRCYIQYDWARHLSNGVDYAGLNVWILGPLFGLGALLGDAIESFFKRARGVPAGISWFPFDQLDYIAGGLLLSSLVVRLSLQQYVVIVIMWFSLHVLSSYIGFLFDLKERPI